MRTGGGSSCGMRVCGEGTRATAARTDACVAAAARRRRCERKSGGERVGVHGRELVCLPRGSGSAGGSEIREKHVLVCGIMLHEALGKRLWLLWLGRSKGEETRFWVCEAGDARDAAALAAMSMSTRRLRHARCLGPLDWLHLHLLVVVLLDGMGRPDERSRRGLVPVAGDPDGDEAGVDDEIKLALGKEGGFYASSDARLVNGAWRKCVLGEAEDAATGALLGVRWDPSGQKSGSEVRLERGLKDGERRGSDGGGESVEAGEEGDCVGDGDGEGGCVEGHFECFEDERKRKRRDRREER